MSDVARGWLSSFHFSLSIWRVVGLKPRRLVAKYLNPNLNMTKHGLVDMVLICSDITVRIVPEPEGNKCNIHVLSIRKIPSDWVLFICIIPTYLTHIVPHLQQDEHNNSGSNEDRLLKAWMATMKRCPKEQGHLLGAYREHLRIFQSVLSF